MRLAPALALRGGRAGRRPSRRRSGRASSTPSSRPRAACGGPSPRSASARSGPSRAPRASAPRAPAFGTASARATSTFAMRNTVERLCTSSPGASNGAPASAQMSASPRRVDDDARAEPADAALRRDVDRDDAALLDLDAERERVQQQSAPPPPPTSSSQTRFSDSGSYVMPVPAPYVFGRSNAMPRSVRRPTTSSGMPDDDLLRRVARRVEGVEGVEHGRRRAAEKAEAVDEQRRRAGARRRDRRGRPAEPAPTTSTSTSVAHLCKSMHV